MALALRRIRDTAPTACVSVAHYEPTDAADTMAEICKIVDWFRLGLVYRQPDDALLSVLMRLQRSDMFGEPVPPPMASRELRDQFERRVDRLMQEAAE